MGYSQCWWVLKEAGEHWDHFKERVCCKGMSAIRALNCSCRVSLWEILHSVGLRTNLETMPIKSPVGASCLCTKFSLAVQSKYAFNWFCSLVVCKAGEPECYKGLKT